MKATIKYIGYLLGATLSLAAMFTACNTDDIDYPDRFKQTKGVPKVYYVREAEGEVAITQASMEQLVCLVGENLTSIHDLYFNDQPAILNTSYMTKNTLLVAVPKGQAVVVTDKIYMITKDSTVVTYDFKVLAPTPKISGMSCEWAQPGETVTIRGSYFTSPLTVEFPGCDPIQITSTTSTEAFDVKIPVGAQPGKIKVTTDSGTAQSVFMYKDTRGLLFDFDGVTGLDNHGWNGHSYTTDDTAISGNFIQLGDGSSVLNEGTWDESHFSFVYWPGSWNDPEDYSEAPRLTDFADFTNWTNMALKFEMYIPSSSPWTNCSMQICFAGVDKVTSGAECDDIYGNHVAGANNLYMTSNESPRALYNPWKSTGSFDTGDKWITVTLPFSEFIYGWDGNPSPGTLSADSFTSMWMFVCQGNIVEGVDTTPIIKIDNIRAVPYK